MRNFPLVNARLKFKKEIKKLQNYVIIMIYNFPQLTETITNNRWLNIPVHNRCTISSIKWQTKLSPYDELIVVII